MVSALLRVSNTLNSSLKFPSLEQLFGAYLHQDWCDEFESPEEAVDAFRSGEPVEAVSAAKQELGELMAIELDENSLSDLIGNLGCYYQPSSDGMSVRDWLANIKASLG